MSEPENILRCPHCKYVFTPMTTPAGLVCYYLGLMVDMSCPACKKHFQARATQRILFEVKTQEDDDARQTQ